MGSVVSGGFAGDLNALKVDSIAGLLSQGSGGGGGSSGSNGSGYSANGQWWGQCGDSDCGDGGGVM